MSNIILLFACMLIGMALRRYGRVPENAHAAINGFIINVSLPALTLLQIHRIELHAMLAYAVVMPWLLFTIAALFFWAVSKVLKFAPATTGGLILVAGLGNTSFVGLPMLEAFYGRPAGGLAGRRGSEPGRDKCSISPPEAAPHKKSRVRPASPRSHPTSPVNGAGGITGCQDYSEPPGVVPVSRKYFSYTVK
jgi:Membrane transport protein